MKKYYLFMLLVVNTCFAAAPDKLSVILDWFPNPDHAPLVIAQQQGFFKKHGLDVQLIAPADPSDAPKWVAAKKADIGITYEPSLMEDVDQKLPLKRIGSLIDKPLSCIVVLKDSGIKSIADLKGKRIGSTSSGLSSVMLMALLQKQGLSDKDVQLVNVRYNLTQALLTHQVDAVSGMMRNFEVPELEATNHKVTAFFPEEYGVPNYSELVLVVNTASEHDTRFPRFLAALKEAVAYLDEHPKESWEGFAKQYPESNNAVNREAWFDTMPYFAEDPAGLDKVEWKNFAGFMQKHQLIKKSEPISDYAIDEENVG